MCMCVCMFYHNFGPLRKVSTKLGRYILYDLLFEKKILWGKTLKFDILSLNFYLIGRRKLKFPENIPLMT